VSAIPVPDPDLAEKSQRMVISGDVPSPLDPPSGCRFRTRCPCATEQCAQEEPELRELSPGHLMACHLPSGM
jgi:oligopeptide transport system ATP-binding protein